MTQGETRPSIAERYAGACDTSDLRVNTEHVCAADILIAAGWSSQARAGMASRRAHLGSLLFRAKNEFDLQRASLAQVRRHAHAQQSVINALRAAAAKEVRQAQTEDAELHFAQAHAIEAQMQTELANALSLLLSRLPSLMPARRALETYGYVMAAVKYLELADDDTDRVAAQVLDVYLDPLCLRCVGLGATGSVYSGETKAICKACHGSGNRKTWLGATLTEAYFGRWLLTDIEEMVSTTAGRIKKVLRRRDADVA